MTTPTPTTIDDLASISLAELNDLAELLTRTDRKYIVSEELLGGLLSGCGDDIVVLEIDGRREFAYESVYFDTADMALHRAAAAGRRYRFKARTRMYQDSGVAVLEVKSKDGRGRTVKNRLDYDVADRHRLTEAGRSFVDELAAAPGIADTLAPVLTTQYRRSTLVDLRAGTRATIDRGLVCTDPHGGTVTLDRVIIETKSDRGTSAIDQWIWRHGARPAKMSKYCTALAVLQPDLPANKWRRTLDRYFR